MQASLPWKQRTPLRIPFDACRRSNSCLNPASQKKKGRTFVRPVSENKFFPDAAPQTYAF
jgi:hypothetical protein